MAHAQLAVAGEGARLAVGELERVGTSMKTLASLPYCVCVLTNERECLMTASADAGAEAVLAAVASNEQLEEAAPFASEGSEL